MAVGGVGAAPGLTLHGPIVSILTMTAKLLSLREVRWFAPVTEWEQSQDLNLGLNDFRVVQNEHALRIQGSHALSGLLQCPHL